MADFAAKVASLNRLATLRLGGTTWELDGVEVTAIYDARYKQVNFGDERYKNVDMTGVGINSTGPVLLLPTANIPEGVTKGSEAYNVTDETYFKILSIENDNGMSYVRMKRET